MLRLQQIWKPIVRFVLPTKTLLYSTPLTPEEIYDLVNQKHKEFDSLSVREVLVALRPLYQYRNDRGTVYLKHRNNNGLWDVEAYIELESCTPELTTLSVTYYKPLMGAGALIAFGSFMSIPLGWWLIPISFIAGFCLNYVFFLTGWNSVETEMQNTFNAQSIL